MMVPEDHDDLRSLVAERDLGRLTPDDRRHVEEHLAACPSCAELTEDVRFIRQQVRDAGDTLFEPHPEPSDLREYARRREIPTSRVGRHLLVCGTCRLEVEGWRSRRSAQTTPARQDRGRGRWWGRSGVATAAAALLGLVAGWRFHASFAPGPTPSAVPGPAAETDGRETHDSGSTPSPGGPSGAGATTVAPAPVLHLLPGLLRDGQPPRQRWILDEGETAIGVAVPIVLPASASNSDRFRFELRPRAGQPVWSQEMTAARMREHLESAEVVNLILAVPQALAVGEYEFRVVPSSAAPSAPRILYRAEITVAYRQSPVATKPPQ